MHKQILNVDAISKMLWLPRTDEPKTDSLDSPDPGIFIGGSEIYSMPALLSIEKALNPHILVVGMSGSGKSFLLRSLITRLCVIEESKIIVIDFTGEYQENLQIQFISAQSADTAINTKNGIIYFNLSSKAEAEKIKFASDVLQNVLILMRNQTIGTDGRIYVVLDEAWKLLKTEISLETIIREGRKYGLGLILSSQLIEDADNAIISNIATLFLFRTQNKKSLERISKNYGIGEEYMRKVQNLELGSCLTVQLHKSNFRSAFIIRKVVGLGLKKAIKIKIDDDIGIEMGSNELEELLERLCPGKHESLSVLVKQRESITLIELIKQLLSQGADKAALLMELRKLGFEDDMISDSFSFALLEIGDENEDK